jgi:hypothetical protein
MAMILDHEIVRRTGATQSLSEISNSVTLKAGA